MQISNTDLKRIYQENISIIYKYFFFKTLNKDLSEDLTSETFLMFAKQIKNADVESPEAYIKGIAKNVFSAYLRTKYQSKEESVDNETIDQWSDNSEQNGSQVDYSKLLEQLLPYFPLNQRIVMEMRFIEKLSIQEIAKKLGKNENYVSTTQKRGFKTLKKILSVQKVQLR